MRRYDSGECALRANDSENGEPRDGAGLSMGFCFARYYDIRDVIPYLYVDYCY